MNTTSTSSQPTNLLSEACDIFDTELSADTRLEPSTFESAARSIAGHLEKLAAATDENPQVSTGAANLAAGLAQYLTEAANIDTSHDSEQSAALESIRIAESIELLNHGLDLLIGLLCPIPPDNLLEQARDLLAHINQRTDGQTIHFENSHKTQSRSDTKGQSDKIETRQFSPSDAAPSTTYDHTYEYDHTDEAMEEFLGEAEVLLEDAYQAVVGISSSEQDYSNRVERAFRNLHSVKGSAGMFGLKPVVALAHGLEELLRPHLAGGRLQRLTLKEEDILLSGLDRMRYYLETQSRRHQKTFTDSNKLEEDDRIFLDALKNRSPAAAGYGFRRAPSWSEAAPAWRQAAGTRLKGMVRVDPDILDRMMEIITEATAARRRLSRQLRKILRMPDAPRRDVEEAIETSAYLSIILSEASQMARTLQSTPAYHILDRFKRQIQEMAKSARKEVELHAVGGTVAVERRLLEPISEILAHLIRNAVDHGIEPPSQREAAGKSPVGNIEIKFRRTATGLQMSVADDGRGLDTDALWAKATEMEVDPSSLEGNGIDATELMFIPGLTTAPAVTDLSGRGIGMDVVRRTAQEAGGDVAVSSQRGHGTTVSVTFHKPASSHQRRRVSYLNHGRA